MDGFYSIPELRDVGWCMLALIYVGFLLLFTHVDLVINTINDQDKQHFADMLIQKHAHFVSLAVNIGLLLFIVVDTMISVGRKSSMLMVTLFNLVGVLSCVVLMMCALGHVNPEMRNIGAIESDSTAWFCMVIFCVTLVVLKKNSLSLSET